ncbi:MAG: M20/M25/M40 family metallo-hydrolase [Fimbriimonadaceae bacterium]|nr:M20/M25/M40 family metallo-hydrolase [Fimbriimonadaceae bacterium]
MISTAVLTLSALMHPVRPVRQSVPNDRLAMITPAGLRAHVKFLAGDALQGRGTPSVGLDIAAEYIAARFEAAGLDPLPDGSYFQVHQYQDKSVRNVVGILPGRDPKLKATYVFLTAHYDHLGAQKRPEGNTEDAIYNGANDNASGTAGVIASAEVLGALKGTTKAPKRTIVFMTFWGEERGLLGAREYVKQPLFPVKDTVGMINLEQIGRTDDSEGPRVGALSVTGYDFSDLPSMVEATAQKSKVKLEKHPKFNEPFFNASDNAAFAAAGIPAHTFCTAFQFADYHQPADHWDKLNYSNMAVVTRFIASATLTLANSDRTPVWNAALPKTERYRKARG